jgi:nucleotide-binding universal stress UspA family protein
VDADQPKTPPRRILLATDLSSRSDRALDRATQLANQWGAELVIVHALDPEAAADRQDLPSWRRPPDTAAVVEAQIRGDMRGECPSLSVLVEEKPPLRLILDAVEQARCDLVVVGIPRSRTFGFPALGRTLDELFRRAPVSVLVVKRRLREAYRHLLVGVDFSPEARVGLETAARFFPEAYMTVMHAFELPYRSLLNSDTQLSRDFGEMERATMRDFTDGADLSAAMRTRLQPLIEHGPPEQMLAAYAAERAVDLTVIGAYERGRLFHTLVGGKGPRILETVPSDVLVVRAERGGEPAA